MTTKLPNLNTEAGRIWTEAINLYLVDPQAGLTIDCPNVTTTRRLVCNLHRLRSKLREAVGETGVMAESLNVPILNRLIVRQPAPLQILIEADDLRYASLVLTNSKTGELINGTQDSTVHDNERINSNIESSSI